MHWLARTFVFFLLASALPAADPDWDALNAETLRHYQAMIQIDTSGEPNYEAPLVEYLKGVLEAEGIPVQIFALEEKRPNLVARLKGNGSKRPLLLMAHTDTVNVDASKWPTAGPFSAARDGGYIYGRGTLDDKDNLVAALMTMVTLKRTGAPLDRDIIFMAEAGEESNTRVGIAYMVQNHWPAIEAEYCIAEGGVVNRQGGKLLSVNIATTEKVPARAKLVVLGTSGHGSVPLADNAIARVSSAVAKAAAWKTPTLLNDTTRYYFERLALVSSPEQARIYNGISNPDTAAESLEYLRLHEPVHYSMLHTSISPTMIQSGYRANVIPAQAEATLDIRAAPGEDIDAFFDELARQIGDDGVQIERMRMTRDPAPPSTLDSLVYSTFEELQKELYPGAVTLPTMLNGATDMALLRPRGMQCYGVGPLTDLEDRAKGYGPHADQERIIEEELYRFTRFLYESTQRIAVR